MLRVDGWPADERERRADSLAAVVRRAWRAVAALLAKTVASSQSATIADAALVSHEWQAALDDLVLGQVGRDVYDAAGNVAHVLGVPVALDEDAASTYLRAARNRLVGVADDVWRDVQEQLVLGHEAGEHPHGVAARVRAVAGVSRVRSLVIARTEVHAAHEAGSYEQALWVDPHAHKEWLGTSDDRTRPTHRTANGQRVEVGTPFLVGTALLRYPGDPLGQPQETINCRCSTAYLFPGDETYGKIGPEGQGATSASESEEMTAVTAAGGWKPELHPRGHDGKFIDKGSPLYTLLTEVGHTGGEVASKLNVTTQAEWDHLTPEQKQHIHDTASKLTGTARVGALARIAKLGGVGAPGGKHDPEVDAFLAEPKSLVRLGAATKKLDDGSWAALSDDERKTFLDAAKSIDLGKSPLMAPTIQRLETLNSKHVVQKVTSHLPAPAAPGKPAHVIAAHKGAAPGTPAKVTTALVWEKHPPGTVILERTQGGVHERVRWDDTAKTYVHQREKSQGGWQTVKVWNKKQAYESLKGDKSWQVPGGGSPEKTGLSAPPGHPQVTKPVTPVPTAAPSKKIGYTAQDLSLSPEKHKTVKGGTSQQVLLNGKKLANSYFYYDPTKGGYSALHANKHYELGKDEHTALESLGQVVAARKNEYLVGKALAAAGHTKTSSSTTSVKGWHSIQAGFRTAALTDTGEVHVRHVGGHQWTSEMSSTRLQAYAKSLHAAGFHIEEQHDDHGNVKGLVVGTTPKVAKPKSTAVPLGKLHDQFTAGKLTTGEYEKALADNGYVVPGQPVDWVALGTLEPAWQFEPHVLAVSPSGDRRVVWNPDAQRYLAQERTPDGWVDSKTHGPYESTAQVPLLPPAGHGGVWHVPTAEQQAAVGDVAKVSPQDLLQQFSKGLVTTDELNTLLAQEHGINVPGKPVDWVTTTTIEQHLKKTQADTLRLVAVAQDGQARVVWNPGLEAYEVEQHDVVHGVWEPPDEWSNYSTVASVPLYATKAHGDWLVPTPEQHEAFHDETAYAEGSGTGLLDTHQVDALAFPAAPTSGQVLATSDDGQYRLRWDEGSLTGPLALEVSDPNAAGGWGAVAHWDPQVLEEDGVPLSQALGDHYDGGWRRVEPAIDVGTPTPVSYAYEQVISNWPGVAAGKHAPGAVVALSTDGKYRLLKADGPGYLVQVPAGGGHWKTQSEVTHGSTLDALQALSPTWVVPPKKQSKTPAQAAGETLFHLVDDVDSGAMSITHALDGVKNEFPGLTDDEIIAAADDLAAANSPAMAGVFRELYDQAKSAPQPGATQLGGPDWYAKPDGTPNWSALAASHAALPAGTTVARSGDDIYELVWNGQAYEVRYTPPTATKHAVLETVGPGQVHELGDPKYDYNWHAVPYAQQGGIAETPGLSPGASTLGDVPTPVVTAESGGDVAGIPYTTHVEVTKQFKAAAGGKVGYWSKPQSIWDTVKQVQAQHVDENGEPRYTPLQVLKMLDGQLKTKEQDPYQKKIVAWLGTPAGKQYAGAASPPTPSAVAVPTAHYQSPQLPTVPATVKKTAPKLPGPAGPFAAYPTTDTPGVNVLYTQKNNPGITPDDIFAKLHDAPLGTVLAYGQSKYGKHRYRLVVDTNSAGERAARYDVLAGAAGGDHHWSHGKYDWNKSKTPEELKKQLYGTINWVTAENAKIKAPVKLPAAVAGELGVGDITGIPGDVQKSIYDTFWAEKGTGVGTTFQDNPGKIYDIISNLAQSTGYSKLQVLQAIDEQQTKKYGVYGKNEHKWEKAVVSYLKTKAGGAAAGGGTKFIVKGITLDGHGGIAHIDKEKRGEVFAHFKGLTKGQLLSSSDEDVFSNVWALSELYANQPGFGSPSMVQVAQMIDEGMAESLGKPNAHLFQKKIESFYHSPKGQAYVTSKAYAKNPIVGEVFGTTEVPLPKGVHLLPGQRVQAVAGPGKYDPALQEHAFKSVTAHEMQQVQDEMLAAAPWTPGQRAALRNYTSGAYFSFNGYLRGKQAHANPNLKRKIINAQAGMRPLTRPVLGVRGTGWDQLPAGFRDAESAKKLIGKTITDPAFVSTSAAGSGGNFGGAIRMMVEMPTGTPVAFVKSISHNKQENEIILAAGTQFHVVSVTDNGFGVTMRVRVVSQ